jgi:hypothetical protein
MAQCASIRKRGSLSQCKSKAVFGHTLCGRHARCKQPVLWATLHKPSSIVRIQALVRGWLVRRRLALAGPGVLCRKNITNEEDLVTCESRVHPFEYFGFEEGGKLWWFQFSTLWTWCVRSSTPINPYTKVPLDTETLKRLHALWSYHWRRLLPLPTETSVYQERVQHRANVICQVLANYGFGEIDRQLFTSLSIPDLSLMFRLIYDDIQFALPDTHPSKSMILRYCLQAPSVLRAKPNSLHGLYILMVLLLRLRDPYVFAFTTLSAVYRL